MSKIKIVNNTIQTAKIILYKKLREDYQFLLVKEQEGFYNFPGGAQDVEDQTIEKTAERELFEELSLTRTAYTLYASGVTYEFVHTDKKSNRYGKKGILHAFFGMYNENETIKIASDLQDYKWFTADVATEQLSQAYPYLKDVFIRVITSMKLHQ